MGVPTSEVGYTAAMLRREDHEVHKDMWGGGIGGKKKHYYREDKKYLLLARGGPFFKTVTKLRVAQNEGTSGVAEKLLDSQLGLCSTYLVAGQQTMFAFWFFLLGH